MNEYRVERRKEMIFCNFLYQKIINREKLNKRDTERFAAQFDIYDKNTIKELCELAIVYRARELAQTEKSLRERYNDIVQLYYAQVNLSHRTSQSVMLQQYSTPAPISFLAGSFLLKGNSGLGTVKRGGRFTKNHFSPEKTVRSYNVPPIYFEPSAGNGLLTVALPAEQVWVNEIDEFRSLNLAEQPYAQQLRQDATAPFDMPKKFDGVITNPPFGKLDKTLTVDSFPIDTLDHAMAIRALDCMKDTGRAAIIIGGHTEYDSEGRIKKGKNRIFFSYLYKHYHVSDVINIDGDLYSRQGTSFNVRLILIDGRKAKPEGFPPISRAEEPIRSFDTLFDRVQQSIGGVDIDLPKRLAKAKAIAKLKILELLTI